MRPSAITRGRSAGAAGGLRSTETADSRPAQASRCGSIVPHRTAMPVVKTNPDAGTAHRKRPVSVMVGLLRKKEQSVEDDAVPDVRHAVGHVAHLRVVGDDQERPTLALRQGAEQLEDLRA